MRIGVIGSGALGLYYGSMLQRNGGDIHFLLRRDYDAIRVNGLQVYSPNGNFHLPQLNAYRQATDIGPVDLVIVGLKTGANDQLVELVSPLVGPRTAILTLQNGLGNEELLAAAFGAERILGGVAYLGTNRGEPGVLHHIDAGKIDLGEFDREISARCRNLAAMFNAAGVPCRAVEDLRRIRWEKLGWNIPFNGLAALHRCNTAELMAHPPSKELARQIMLEVAAGANAQPLKSRIDAQDFSKKLIAFTEKMNPYRPSMLVDREQGRPMELEAIFATPLRQAKAAGVEMPRIEMLYQLLDFCAPKPVES